MHSSNVHQEVVHSCDAVTNPEVEVARMGSMCNRCALTLNIKAHCNIDECSGPGCYCKAVVQDQLSTGSSCTSQFFHFELWGPLPELLPGCLHDEPTISAKTPVTYPTTGLGGDRQIAHTICTGLANRPIPNCVCSNIEQS